MKRQGGGHEARESHIHAFDGVRELVVLVPLLGELLEDGAGVEPHPEVPPELVQHVAYPDVLGLAEDPVAAFGVGYHLGVASRCVQKSRIGASGLGASDLDVRYAMVHADDGDFQVSGQGAGCCSRYAKARPEAWTHGERHQIDVLGRHPRLVEGFRYDAGDDIRMVVGHLPRMEASGRGLEHVDLVSVDLAVRIDNPYAQRVSGSLDAQRYHRPAVPRTVLNTCRNRSRVVQRLHRHESDVYPEVVAKDCPQTDVHHPMGQQVGILQGNRAGG